LLRTGYGGSSGPLSNINQEGFPSAAFHSYPNTLQWDGITGDYGPGFLGMALNSGTYVDDDPDLGLVAYGGILTESGGTVTIQTKDVVQRRVFIGPLGVMITVDAGAISQISYTSSGSVSITIAQQSGSPVATQAAVWVESANTWTITTSGINTGRGGWIVPLAATGTKVVTMTQS
jgi:hypothetical protein